MNDRLYHIRSGYMVEEIAGQYVLMAPASGDVDYSRMMVLSESAAFVARLMIGEPMGFDALLQALLGQYEAEEGLVRTELVALLARLEELGVFGD